MPNLPEVMPNWGDYTLDESSELAEDGWHNIMALHAYVDDSGSDPSSPVYVLGGVIMPEEWWAIVANEWSSVLASEPKVDYFKASEVWDRSQGPFCRMSDQQRMDKVYALVDVLTEYHPVSFSCRMRWQDFRNLSENVKLPKSFNDPYFFLFYGAIIGFVPLFERDERVKGISFVFDEQGRIGKSVCGWYEAFASLVDPTRTYLGPKPSFGDEKKVIPLQAADLVAWYQRRKTLGSLNQEWHQNVWNLLKRSHFPLEMGEQELQKMSKDLGLSK